MLGLKEIIRGEADRDSTKGCSALLLLQRVQGGPLSPVHLCSVSHILLIPLPVKQIVWTSTRSSYRPVRPARGRKVRQFLSRIHLRWGTGLPPERERRVTKRACTGDNGHWSGLDRLDTNQEEKQPHISRFAEEWSSGQDWLLFIPNWQPTYVVQASKEKRMRNRPCLGFPVHDLL